MDETAAIFILLLIALVSVSVIVLTLIRRRPLPAARETGETSRQIEALRRDNERLSERLAVLETIAIDPAHRTAREIESLR